MIENPVRPHSLRSRRWAIAIALAALTLFLALTPPGLLTKADVLGYAVCHRIHAHSFVIAGRQLPLCARCTGTFIGALVGIFGQAVVLRRRRESDLPALPVLIAMGAFLLLWGGDGFNSYVNMVRGTPLVYPPQQWLRLATGSLAGLSLSALIYPIVNLSVWTDPAPKPAIRNLGELGLLVLMEAGLVALVLLGWDLLLYPIALLSGLGVLTMLTLTNSLLLMIVLRWENRCSSWREAIPSFALGMTLALIQISAIGLVRYLVTGTLGGFPGL